MRVKYANCRQFLLIFIGAVSAQETLKTIEYETVESNDHCESYCFNVLKPLLENVEQSKNKIDNYDNDMQYKDEYIVKLEKELANLRVNETIFKKLETLYIDEIKHKDDLIAALEQRTSLNNNNGPLIASLKVQIDENTAAVNLLKTQLSSLNDSILLQNYNAEQNSAMKIKEIPINCVPFENSTSIHEINLPEIGQFSVLCDGQTAGTGWTVVQRRFDGSENFYRSWREYSDGFGNLQGEFFMGLEKLHRMTKSLPYELYIELIDFGGQIRHARYDNFHIGSEEEQYMLKSLGTYSGSAGNALNYNLHDSFTTFDRDNDGWPQGNCAKYYASGWWYGLYGNSNLNGKYFDCEVYNEESIWWYDWKGYKALSSVKMMIRPKYSSI